METRPHGDDGSTIACGGIAAMTPNAEAAEAERE